MPLYDRVNALATYLNSGKANKSMLRTSGGNSRKTISNLRLFGVNCSLSTIRTCGRLRQIIAKLPG